MAVEFFGRSGFSRFALECVDRTEASKAGSISCFGQHQVVSDRQVSHQKNLLKTVSLRDGTAGNKLASLEGETARERARWGGEQAREGSRPGHGDLRPSDPVYKTFPLELPGLDSVGRRDEGREPGSKDTREVVR